MAMLAMDDKDLDGEFRIWAGDLSRRVIQIARTGRYGARAVASLPTELRHRYLRDVSEGATPMFEIADVLRQRVRFMAINIVNIFGLGLRLDVIFCHNVLIYFSPATVSRVVALLAGRLNVGGYLLLGPGEAPSERPPGLELVSVNGARAFRRTSAWPIEVRA